MMPVDIETQVREYTESLVSATSPISREDIQADAAVDLILDGTQQTVVRSRLSGLGRGLLVAGAVAVGVVVVGLMAFLTDPIDDSVPAATSPGSTPADAVSADAVEWPGLTADIPEGVESGTLSTPLGTARWVHLSSDEFTLPGVGDLMISADDGFRVSSAQFLDWQSEDGIEWRTEDSSIELDGMDIKGAEMFWSPHVDGSYGLVWVVNEDPLEIWALDYANSGEVDLSGLAPPESDGFVWALDISRPLTRYRPETVQSVFQVGFSGPDGHVDQRLLVIEATNQGDDVAYVEVPWDVSSEVTLFGTSHSFYAFVRDPGSNQVSVWRTEDGYRWTESDSLHAQLGVPSTLSLQITVLPALQTPENGRPIRNQMVVVTSHGSGWESTNGTDWTPSPEGIPDRTHPIRLESGWFATDGNAWWMHAGNWVSLAELGIERTGDGCQTIPSGSGQTTLVWSTCTPESPPGLPTDLWIISLDS